jgi:phenylacetate-CoA ligase
MRLGPVLGRRQQMIKYKGTTLYPATISNLMEQIPAIKEYCIHISKDELGNDLLTLLMQQEGDEEALQSQVRDACRQQFRVTPDCKFLSPADMQALQFPRGSRKQRRIIDLRQDIL